MSRKEKLAEEMYPIDPNRWGTIPCHNDYQIERRKAFLAGYAACEQDAKELVDTLEKILVKPLGWSDVDYKHIFGILYKWKERWE